MDYHLAELFLREIKQQCEFAISDYNDIAFAISKTDSYMLFHSLQAFLIAVANISKIFWPVKSKYNQRGQDLKNLLIINESSPIKTRDPRNVFEHFDERLEDWYNESPHHNLIDMSVGSRDDVVSGQVDFIRYFNTTEYTFRFRGDKYEIKPLYEALTELLTKVNAELIKPPSMQFPP